MPPPIPIDEAFARVIKHAGSAPIRSVPLAQALGHVLAEDVKADRDWPPFNRSMVDGYAVFSNDTRSAPDVLEVIEEVPAGKQPQKVLSPGQAIRIMTGAPVPAGADAVIMQERTEVPRAGYVKFTMTMKPGQNIARRGEDAQAGAAVIAAGTRITPTEIGVLAAVGHANVSVRRKPRVAILGTGDELVEPHVAPQPAQIRNSNSHQLLAQCAAQALEATYLGIAPDQRDATRKLVEAGLQSDLFISTGGVSVGEHDHVGAAFKELGVEIVFDRVAIKPGKPTTFGRRGETLVFGLPGNPVAAFVCFHLFVLTAVRQQMGASEALPRQLSLPIDADLKVDNDRTTFRPCRLVVKEERTWVQPIAWHGSGHLAALVGADGLCVQKVGEEIKRGDVVAYYPL